jgi:hypothetical protein
MGKASNAQSDGADDNHSGSRNNLHDKKRSVDVGSYKQNMLVPKLPFMKQGERISKFGAGYSKLLNRSPPMSPVPLSNQMMHPSGLMSPQYPVPPSYQQYAEINHAHLEPATPPSLIN